MEGKTYFAHLLISHDNRSIQAKCVLYAFSTVEVNDTYTTYLASDIKSLLNVYSDIKKMQNTARYVDVKYKSCFCIIHGIILTAD